MRTHLQFRCEDLLDLHDDGDTPHGKRLSQFLTEHLPAYDFQIERVIPEDWGWYIGIVHGAFPLWIGCGFYPDVDDGLLCFIHPSKPQLRRWFRRISTEETVERLACALEDILSVHPKVHDLRWWN